MSLAPSEKEVYLDKALQKSAYYSNLMLCTWLLDQGANINFVGGEFGGPLPAAVSYLAVGDAATQNNRSLILAMFLKRGANVNLSDPKRAWPSPLMAAMKSHYHKATSLLLAAGADVNWYGGKLYSPVQCAARHSTAALGLILDKGVDFSVVGEKYGTALHAAAYAHDLERLKLLLERGADATIIAGKYGSCIQAAAKKHSQCSTFLTERQSVEAMELLLEHGASVTAMGGSCGSALHHAAKQGNLEAVKWLIAHGADPITEGGQFRSALQVALAEKQYAVISFLGKYLSDLAPGSRQG
jgi:ankyrin repeat protein